MSFNVGINGFGRIGKSIVRIIEESSNSNIRIRAIKDFNNTNVSNEEYIKNMAYLLQNDSIYGKFPGKVDSDGKNLILSSHKIPVFLDEDIKSVDWNDLGCDLLIESSGTISNINSVKDCLGDKVKKIIITRGVENVDFTLLFGVNEELFDHEKHQIISTSTCTGNAFAPIANFIDQNFGISNGFLSTIHPLLSNEKMIDGFNKSFGLGRGARNIKLTPTSITKSTLAVLPHLKNKISETSLSYRIPTDIVSAVYGILVLDKFVSSDHFFDLLNKEIKDGKLKGIIDLCDGLFGHSKVSLDYLKDTNSGIIDKKWVECKDKLIRLHIWHDNEYGYCRRVYDALELIKMGQYK